MNKRKFKALMMILGLIIAVEVLIIVAYPMFNTHEEVYVVNGWFPRDGKMRLVIGDLTLNLTAYFPHTVEVHHSYRIRWVDGLNFDYVLKWEEVPG